MSLSLLQEPVQSYEDSNGKPLNGGKLFTYAAGTTTPKATYQDAAGTIANTNPVILNERGEATVYGSGNYRFILQNSVGATIWDRDNVSSPPSSVDLAGDNGAALVGWDGGTLADYLRTKNSRIVTSIAALRGVDKTKYNFCFVTGYYGSGDGGGGQYWYDSTDTTGVDDGGSIIVAADGGRWKLAETGTISVRQFGAKGDNSTDDSVAFQAALNYAQGVLKTSTGTGVKLRIPGGRYVINASLTATIRADKTIIDDGDFRRLTIEGDGQANTYLIYKGPSGTPALSISGYTAGANTDGSHLYLVMKGFRLWRDLATPRLGGGVALNKAAYVMFEDVSIGYFNVNLDFTDVLGFTSIDSSSVGGNGGLNSRVVAFTRPNGFTFLRGRFSGNLEFGIQATDVANWNFTGTFFEGNGDNIAADYTINLIGGPAEGGATAIFDGCYFEGNTGIADINVAYNSANSGTVCVRGCSFNRNGTTAFNTHHINLSSNAGGKLKAHIHGNGFKSFNGYVPNAARSVVTIQTTDVDVDESGGNYYQNATEKPNYQGFPVVNDGYGKLSMTGRVASGGTLVVGWNVASITKTGTGVYRLNYKNALAVSATVIATVTIVGNDGYGYVSGENAAYLEITTKNVSGVATDQNFNVISYAQG